MPSDLQLTRPDDWHLHLRDGPVLSDVVAATAASLPEQLSCRTSSRR